MSAVLAAILASPPLTTGQRTRARLEMAREFLGYEVTTVANLVATPTHNTGDLANVGLDPAVWLLARPALSEAIANADGVLLGYGTTPPTGPAREHFKAQTAWLTDLIAVHHLEVVMIGGVPRHPSRWQRWTSRQYPDLVFADALRLELGHHSRTRATPRLSFAETAPAETSVSPSRQA